MRALVIVPGDGDGAYEARDVPEPAIGPRDLLVAVRATALNRADISQRAGRYRQQATAREGLHIAGLESAGVVVDAGADVRHHRIGDRVMGMCGGGFAEFLAMDERLAIPIPESLDWIHAAATPVAMMTEHDAIATRAELRAGESLVVHAAASGVGLMGVQIAKLLGAAPLLGTVADPRQAALVRELGADDAINFHERDFEQAVAEATVAGVDVVIDHVGGPYLAANLRAMAVGGRLVSVGRLGPTVGEIDLDLLARKNLKLLGVSFRTRDIDQYGAIARAAIDAVLPAIADGRVRPVVDRVFDLDEAAEAQDHMLANRHLGKIVLSVGED
jgi:NADPH:quinone reductase